MMAERAQTANAIVRRSSAAIFALIIVRYFKKPHKLYLNTLVSCDSGLSSECYRYRCAANVCKIQISSGRVYSDHELR